MAHRRSTVYFSRKYNARKSLLRGLVASLVEHERITTTVDKAKELRRHVERAITIGKKGDLGTRRLLLSRFPNELVVNKILSDISPRFKNHPGGYTRIVKIGRRPGDQAEMAFIEFVDYNYEKKPAPMVKPKVVKKAKGNSAEGSVEAKPAKKTKSAEVKPKKEKAPEKKATAKKTKKSE